MGNKRKYIEEETVLLNSRIFTFFITTKSISSVQFLLPLSLLVSLIPSLLPCFHFTACCYYYSYYPPLSTQYLFSLLLYFPYLYKHSLISRVDNLMILSSHLSITLNLLNLIYVQSQISLATCTLFEDPLLPNRILFIFYSLP